jgi:predicted nucleic acid-binding protein
VPEAWIIDASPLIILARIAKLDWFERLPSTTLVPQAVIREIAAGAGHDPSAPGAVRWATSRAVADLPVPASIARRGLGDGEAQVITHGQTPERLAVLDDRAARACARAHGVMVIGTLGVICWPGKTA